MSDLPATIYTPELLQDAISQATPAKATLLKTIQQQAPVFHLTLTAMPNESTKRQIVDWFRNNISPIALVNFRGDKTLLAGLILRFGSRFYDWSLDKALTMRGQDVQ